MAATQHNRLGKQLRQLRTKERGWSLAFVDKTFGIDKGMLSRIENGDTRPSLDTLHRLRDCYGVDDQTFLIWLNLLRPERQTNGSAA